jgi:hypothetical protein
MSDLTEFLLARFAEDEEKAAGMDWRPWYPDSVRYELNHDGFMVDPAFVRADCAAKRRIVEVHSMFPGIAGTGSGSWCESDEETWPCDTLRALASVYAGHPDFREEWR